MLSINNITTEDLADGNDRTEVQSDLNPDVSLALLRITHRKILFWVCLIICCLLYALFFGLVGWAIVDEVFFKNLLDHKHIGTLFIVVLIIPSTLLWGMLRAAYMTEDTKKEMDSMAKIIADKVESLLSTAHPAAPN